MDGLYVQGHLQFCLGDTSTEWWSPVVGSIILRVYSYKHTEKNAKDVPSCIVFPVKTINQQLSSVHIQLRISKFELAGLHHGYFGLLRDVISESPRPQCGCLVMKIFLCCWILWISGKHQPNESNRGEYEKPENSFIVVVVVVVVVCALALVLVNSAWGLTVSRLVDMGCGYVKESSGRIIGPALWAHALPAILESVELRIRMLVRRMSFLMSLLFNRPTLP